MEAFFISAGIVALAEVADKTQLLSLLLAARYKKPWPIIAAIFIATLLNHGLAGSLGAWLAQLMGTQVLRWVLGLSFLAMAVWIMIPDKLDEDEPRFRQLGVFGTTLVLFFLAEIGDKTQIATIALAAKYEALVSVVMGTTLGMLLANVPVVFLGDKLAKKLPGKQVHAIAALIFTALGLAALFGWTI
jgi:putative Ca2+/H+ antiporter (TMEM165/GDT1 family)